MKNKIKRSLLSSVYVSDSEVSGRGVFLYCDAKKGDIIEEAHYVELEDTNWLNCDKELIKFVFSIPHLQDDWKEFCDKEGGITVSHVTRPVAVLGNGMIYNHSYENNISYKMETHLKIVTFKATKDIKADEELFIDYGKEYWQNRDDLI